MEKLLLKSLSSGLGFYEIPETSAKEINADKGTARLPDFLLQDNWDFKDTHTYQQMLSHLEKPWLGEMKKPKPVRPTQHIHKTQKLEQKMSEQHSSIKNSVTKNLKLNDANYVRADGIYFKSIFVDTVLASLLFFPCLFLFLFLNETKPALILSATWHKIGLGFLLFTQIYSFLCRLFCSETYGDSMAGRSLYKNQHISNEQNLANTDILSSSASHPWLLFYRFIISCLTGVLILPILSWCFQSDLLAKLTGLYFYKSQIPPPQRSIT